MAVLDMTGGRFDGRKAISGAGGQQTLGPAASTALTVPAGARFAAISPRTQAINVTFGGVTPVTAAGGAGMTVGAGDVLLIGPGQLSGFRMIQTAATATVDVEYFS